MNSVTYRTTESIREELPKIVSNQLNVPPEHLTEDSTMINLGCDSLDSIELIVTIEDYLGYQLDEREFERLDDDMTYAQFCDEVVKQATARNATLTPQ